jgi:hypothetical protein
MRAVYLATGVACDTRVVTIDDAGARWHAVSPEYATSDRLDPAS